MLAAVVVPRERVQYGHLLAVVVGPIEDIFILNGRIEDLAYNGSTSLPDDSVKKHWYTRSVSVDAEKISTVFG